MAWLSIASLMPRSGIAVAFMMASFCAAQAFCISSSSDSRIIVSKPARTWRVMARPFDTQLPTMRMTRGKSLGPMTSKATSAMIASSEESIPNT